MGAKLIDPETEAAVAESQDEPTRPDPTLIELSTGVVLRAKSVPTSLFADLVARFPSPKPPTVFIPEKGREEENPDDPRYLESVREQQARLAQAMSDAVILLGTSVEFMPDGFQAQSDSDWQDEIRLLGYDLHSKRAVYLAWVKFVAAPRPEDYQAIWRAVGRLTGVTESDTADAVRRFSNKAKRNGHH